MSDIPIHGSVDPGFESVYSSFERGLQRAELGAAVCAYLDGRKVVDLWGGWADAVRTRPWRTWFEERPGAVPLHVSARSDLTLDIWEEESEEPEDWSLGLPLELPHVWMWVGDPELVEALGVRPVMRKPGGSPEIEDMVDALLKLRRHERAGDELGVRLEAQAAARCAAPTVAALNSCAPVVDPRSALSAVLTLPVAPPTWGEDLRLCLGLSEAGRQAVVTAANRLVIATLQLVRKTNPGVDAQPEIARYVADGTIERLLS